MTDVDRVALEAADCRPIEELVMDRRVVAERLLSCDRFRLLVVDGPTDRLAVEPDLEMAVDLSVEEGLEVTDEATDLVGRLEGRVRDG